MQLGTNFLYYILWFTLIQFIGAYLLKDILKAFNIYEKPYFDRFWCVFHISLLVLLYFYLYQLFTTLG